MTASSGNVRLGSMRGKILHRRLFAMALAAFVVVLAAVAGAPARAQDSGPPDAATQDLYTARDVKVDVTAESAVQARDQAILEAQAKGLRQVMQEVAAPGATLPEVSGQEAQNYVRSLQVTDERRSNVRYIATMTIQYNPAAVRMLLDRADVRYSETPRTPVLVVPLWQASPDNPPILWEDPNPWRQTWSRRTAGGTQPTQVPLGDLGDLQAISADEAAAGDTQAVRRLLNRYDMTEAVIAHAVQPGQDSVTVDLTRFTLAGEPARQSMTITATEGETQSELLTRTAEEVASRLRADEWGGPAATAATVSPDAAPGQMTVMIPTEGGLGAWLTVRDRLRQVPLVRGVELQALTKSRAQVLMGYVGDRDQLTLTLAQYGLDMTDLGGGIMQIELRRQTAPAPAPASSGGAPSAGAAAPAGAAGAPTVVPAEGATADAPAAPGVAPGQGRVLSPGQ